MGESLCPIDEASALGFRAELAHFLACVRTGSPPLTSGAQALATQRLACCIFRQAGVALP